MVSGSPLPMYMPKSKENRKRHLLKLSLQIRLPNQAVRDYLPRPPPLKMLNLSRRYQMSKITMEMWYVGLHRLPNH